MDPGDCLGASKIRLDAMGDSDTISIHAHITHNVARVEKNSLFVRSSPL